MAIASYVQPGNAVDYTPSGAAVSMGDPVVIGDVVGIAVRDIADGALGAIALEGVYDIDKGVTSVDAIAVGTKLYWDASGEVATATAGSNKVLGYSVAAAAAADTTVRVQLSRA